MQKKKLPENKSKPLQNLQEALKSTITARVKDQNYSDMLRKWKDEQSFKVVLKKELDNSLTIDTEATLRKNNNPQEREGILKKCTEFSESVRNNKNLHADLIAELRAQQDSLARSLPCPR